MWKSLYMVYDITAQTVIGGIILEISDPPAIRAFHDALRMKDSLLAQHPEDYRLLKLAVLDTDGALVAGTQPQIVATGAAWKESQLANA